MLFKVILLCVLLATTLGYPQNRSPEDDSSEYEFSSEESNEDVKPVKPKKEIKKVETTPAPLPPQETTQAAIVVEQASQAVVVEQATQAAVLVEQTSQANIQVVQDSVKIEENYEKKLTIHDKPKLNEIAPKSDDQTTQASLPLDLATQNGQTDPATQGFVQPDLTQGIVQPDPTQAVVQPDQSTQLNMQDLSASQAVVDQIFNTPSLLPADVTNADVRNAASTNAPAVS